MESFANRQFWDAFSELPQVVQEHAQRAYTLWQDDPHHPSLHFKRIHGREPIYSVRIGRRCRALGLKDDDSITWFWIGTHDEYDTINRRR